MHKRGEVRCLVGNNIFTTGYDHPPLDMIIDLQATASTPKHVQKYGRGMRPFPGSYAFPPKQNCLILDYAGNTVRLGPINDPVIPKLKGKGTGDAPVKLCEYCGVYNHTRATECVGCKVPFPPQKSTFQQVHQRTKSLSRIFQLLKLSTLMPFIIPTIFRRNRAPSHCAFLIGAAWFDIPNGFPSKIRRVNIFSTNGGGNDTQTNRRKLLKKSYTCIKTNCVGRIKFACGSIMIRRKSLA